MPSPASSESSTPLAAASPRDPTHRSPSAREVWTARPTILYQAPSDTAAVDAKVGSGFPLLILDSTDGGDGVWKSVTWSTSGRQGNSWVRATDLTNAAPHAPGQADIAALDRSLAQRLEQLGDRIGVQVFDVSRQLVYEHNADLPFIAASSMKVLIMLAFLDQVADEGRELTASERSQLAAMIQESDNDTATSLYAAIGAEIGMAAYLAEIGVDGVRPEGFALGWGWSEISPAAMVRLLELLRSDEILTDPHREFALELMRNPAPHLRYGVGDTAPPAANVAMKTGNVAGPTGFAANSSGIVTLGGVTYVIAVYTVDNASGEEGKKLLNEVCAVIAGHLLGASR